MSLFENGVKNNEWIYSFYFEIDMLYCLKKSYWSEPLLDVTEIRFNFKPGKL